jgi:hypothetical protein
MLPNQGNTIVLDNLNKEHDRLFARKKEIDSQVAQLPANNVRGRQKLMTGFKGETDHINERLVEIDKELPTLQTKQVTQNTEVGPILFLASLLNISPEKAVSFVIGMIVFVFDPLSIVFLITGNRLMTFRDEEKERKKVDQILEADFEEKTPDPEPEPEVVVEPEQTPEEYWPVYDHTEDHPFGPPIDEQLADLPVINEEFEEVVEPVVEPIPQIEFVHHKEDEPPEVVEPEIVEQLPEVIFPEVVAEEPETLPSGDTLDDPRLDELLAKILANNPTGSLTAEERTQIDKALDHIFPTEHHQKAPDEHDEVVVEESIPQPIEVPDSAPVEPLAEMAVYEPEPEHPVSVLQDPMLDNIHGTNHEFVGQHWINPKLLEIYATENK